MKNLMLIGFLVVVFFLSSVVLAEEVEKQDEGFKISTMQKAKLCIKNPIVCTKCIAKKTGEFASTMGKNIVDGTVKISTKVFEVSKRIVNFALDKTIRRNKKENIEKIE